MAVTFELAEQIFHSEKWLMKPIIWKSVIDRNKLEQQRRLECRVRIDGGVPRGVFFRITVFPRSLCRATFQLECDTPDNRTHTPLYRLDLNPVNAHTNKLYGDDEINGRFFPPDMSHEHFFRDSITQDGRLRARTDEQARAVVKPIPDFATALSLVCTRIFLRNGDEIPNPGDQGMLL
jgi:hypothetical protein